METEIKRKYLIFLNFENPQALNQKRFAKTKPNIHRAPVTFAATPLNPMSNILVTIETLLKSV